mmetsp:Transcript_2191/g.4014  ORF Transcript_2191/g.4014 Transcript_2191/m.4014 type:complete len:231 (+) Transcript_2191:419-1111(+)
MPLCGIVRNKPRGVKTILSSGLGRLRRRRAVHAVAIAVQATPDVPRVLRRAWMAGTSRRCTEISLCRLRADILTRIAFVRLVLWRSCFWFGASQRTFVRLGSSLKFLGYNEWLLVSCLFFHSVEIPRLKPHIRLAGRLRCRLAVLLLIFVRTCVIRFGQEIEFEVRCNGTATAVVSASIWVDGCVASPRLSPIVRKLICSLEIFVRLSFHVSSKLVLVEIVVHWFLVFVE